MIVLSNSTANTNVKNILYNDTTINVSAGCTIEYNMNLMLDNILVTTTLTDDDYITSVAPTVVSQNPFYKLFPIDSIVKPLRPANSGVKYYIARKVVTGPNENDWYDPDHLDAGGVNRQFYDYKTIPYPSDRPRVYYPGVQNAYKYWVGPAGQGINLTVTYSISSATVEEAYSTGTKIVYKTTSNHGFKVGNRIKISGTGQSSMNLPIDTNNALTNQIIEVIDSKRFAVSTTVAKTMSPYTGLSGTAEIINSSNVVSSTKPALSNKIVIKFEKYHHLPATCSFVINYSSGSPTTLSDVAVPSSGILNIYWNGTTWSTSEPFNSSQPISYPAPKEVTSIQISTPSAGAEKIIGVIEISARWIKDISSDIASFKIEKESTSNPQDILPVGNITANSLSMSIVRYDEGYNEIGFTLASRKLKALSYNRDEDWTTDPIPDDVIYFVKNAEVKPHIKVKHSAGLITEGSIKYDIVPQGSFFIESFEIQEFGSASIEALDGAKFLMESLAPDLIYEYAPATSVLMSLLDSIGFTNYNFNVTTSPLDTSIPTLAYWWTDNSRTIFDTIKEICRDIQMNAFFDENNILQFYSRDYLYNKSNVDWEFYYEKTGDKLANIIGFKKQDIAQGNQVKIIWRTPLSSLYTQTAKDLWDDRQSILVAGGLLKSIAADTPAENIDFYLDIESLDTQVKFETTSSFNGYFLVDSEIFEYDAIGYNYVPLTSDTSLHAFISNEGDWSNYRALSKTGSENFKPSGRYRIKRRGVFNTEQAAHAATTESSSSWYQVLESEWN